MQEEVIDCYTADLFTLPLNKDASEEWANKKPN